MISIQRKFSYLQSIPGIYAIQRPCLPIQHPYTFKSNNPHLIIQSAETPFPMEDNRRLAGLKRLSGQRPNPDVANKSMNLGYNSPQSGIAGPPPAMWSVPPLLPSTSYSFGALLSNLPSVVPSYNAIGDLENRSGRETVKVVDDQIAGEKVGHEEGKIGLHKP